MFHIRSDYSNAIIASNFSILAIAVLGVRVFPCIVHVPCVQAWCLWAPEEGIEFPASGVR